MKKLLAVLMGCMLMTGTFASCGSSGSSSESGTTTADSSAAASEKAAENSTEGGTEDGTEDVTDEETTTTKKTTLKVTTAPDDDDAVATTTAKTTSKPADDEPEADPSDFHGGDVAGLWVIEERTAYNLIYDFKKDGRLGMYMDISEDLSFGSDGKASFEGDEVSYTFSGNIVKIEYEGEDYLVFTRVSGSGSAIDGTYEITGGTLMEDFEDDNLGMLYIIDGNETYVYNEDTYCYEAKGNELTVTETYKGVESSETSYYDVDGDKLRVLDNDGDVVVLLRTDRF